MSPVTPLIYLFMALLQPVGQAPVVMGIVTDAETGQPIKHFRVLPGSKWDSQFSLFYNRAQEFRDGHYIFSEPIGADNPIVRIEADGYAPATSDELNLEADVEFDVELRKAPNIEARVTTPDGEPAAGADVLLGASFTQISLKNERFDEQAFNFCPRTETDADGRFVFWPVEEDFRVLVIHDSGWIGLSRDELKLLDPLVLQPWGRIEGVLRIGAHPAAGEKVQIQWLDSARSKSGRELFYRRYDVQTDEHGRFTFDRLPAGKGRVGRYIQVSSAGPYTSYGITSSERFFLQPGQAHHIDIGGKGRPVTGRFNLPDGAIGEWSIHSRLSTKPVAIEKPAVPDHIRAQGNDEVSRWWEEYRQSDEYAAIQAAIERDRATHRHYAFALNDDGSFRIEDVLPGTYELSLSASVTTDDQPPRIVQAANAKAEITVPEIPGGRSDEPLNVGEIHVQQVQHGRE